MINPKVTVLMSVYNGEKYLKEAIDSILNQTFKDFEFLIINDCSTDNTVAIILSYHDPRIRLINNKKNVGITCSLNKGIKLSKGAYIARMDGDDISYPQRLEKEISIIEKDKEIGMVTSWIDEFGSINKHSDYFIIVRTVNAPEEIFYTLLFHNCIVHSTVLFKKELVLSLGGYDESYKQSQDYDLWIKISRISKIVKIREALLARRSHENTISRRSIEQKLNADKIFLKNMYKLIPNDISQEILLQIRYNIVRIKNLIRSISIIKNINTLIPEIAYDGLDYQRLKRYGVKKIYQMIFCVLKKEIMRKILRRRLKDILKIYNFDPFQ